MEFYSKDLKTMINWKSSVAKAYYHCINYTMSTTREVPALENDLLHCFVEFLRYEIVSNRNKIRRNNRLSFQQAMNLRNKILRNEWILKKLT